MSQIEKIEKIEKIEIVRTIIISLYKRYSRLIVSSIFVASLPKIGYRSKFV